jgi:hypothetical protein
MNTSRCCLVFGLVAYDIFSLTGYQRPQKRESFVMRLRTVQSAGFETYEICGYWATYKSWSCLQTVWRLQHAKDRSLAGVTGNCGGYDLIAMLHSAADSTNLLF